MLLANYDFKVQYCPGCSNGNADGLSRANQLPTEDTTPSNFSCTTTPAFPEPPLTLDTLAAAVYANEEAGTDDVPDARTLLGPRQALLEAAPCAACKQRIASSSTSSIICDGCNGAYHIACVGMKTVPATYWYCSTCTRQLHTAGIKEPAEDLAFQRYLLTGRVQDEGLRPYFAALAAHYRYEERIHDRHNERHMQL